MWARTLDRTIKHLFNSQINTTTGETMFSTTPGITCIIHPDALGYLDEPMFNGSYYLEKSNRQFLEEHGWTFVPHVIADDDYDGGEDSTTEIHCFANMNDNFRAGIVKPGGWDGWSRTEGVKDYINKYSEIFTAYSIPFEYDTGKYAKAYIQAQITPFNDSA